MQTENKETNKRTRAYVDEAYRQIQEKPGVTDIIVLNVKGNPVKTSMEMSKAIEFSGLYEPLKDKVKTGLEKIDSSDELIMLRVRTIKNETLIVPDGKITLVVIQNP